MRRWILAFALLASASVALPPLFFAVFPVDLPDLPAPGLRVPVGGGVAVNALIRATDHPWC